MRQQLLVQLPLSRPQRPPAPPAVDSPRRRGGSGIIRWHGGPLAAVAPADRRSQTLANDAPVGQIEPALAALGERRVMGDQQQRRAGLACSSNRQSMTASPVARSRLPVGSSASSSAGPATKARAIATRCCSPPESCPG